MRERQTIGIYKLDSIQIYFNGSLEIQEELIKKGLSVPLKTPLPIIYGNVAGYIDGRTSRLALRAALLDPERYGRSLDELGWTIHGRHIGIPREYAELKVELMGNQVILSPHFARGKPGYHLEKASYRGVSPTNWKNWAGFYLALSELRKMACDLGDLTRVALVSWEHEKLPKGGGHEDTYYITSGRDEKGIEPYDFSLCMGCWDNVLEYLANESPRVPVHSFRLRLQKSPDIPTRLKIGLAKMDEKYPQFMIKLSTHPSAKLSIRGINAQGHSIVVKGKPRGVLVACDHKLRRNEVIIDREEFCVAIAACDGVIRGTQSFGRLRLPSWLRS